MTPFKKTQILIFVSLFLPVLFVFHDLEEIIGFGIWGKKNIPLIENRMPKLGLILKKIFEPYSTEGMALAVLEELLLCILVCTISILIRDYQLWVGVFIAFIIHLFVHLIQAIVWRGYIPALATSIITVPTSMIILYESLKILNYSIGRVVLWSVVGLVIIIVNVKFAHFLMHWFTGKW